MQTVKEELEGQGRDDFAMVSINDASAASAANQQKATGIKKKATFPVLQAVSGKGWTSFADCLNRKGKKNDGFIFAPNGTFVRKHEGKGKVYMNVWEDDVRAGLGVKVDDLENCECKDVQQASKNVHHVACVQ